jgi:hypothetical protein
MTIHTVVVRVVHLLVVPHLVHLGASQLLVIRPERSIRLATSTLFVAEKAD